MDYLEIIAATDDLEPNAFTQEQKENWLRRLDERIWMENNLTHEGDSTTFPEEGTALLTEIYGLDIYTHYLQAHIALEQRDYERYNNEITLYNNAYLTYQAYYNRTYAPQSGRYFQW